LEDTALSIKNLDHLFEQVPPAKEVRELISAQLRDVKRLRALLKLAEATERNRPREPQLEVPRAG
jgi:hypothetical protein